MTDLDETRTSPAPELTPIDAAAEETLFTEAHSARVFSDVTVTKEQLIKIWDLAKWAPTSANFQPLRVLYVTTDEGRERLVGHMADMNKAKTAAAPVVAVLALDSQFHQTIPTVFPAGAGLVDVMEANEPMRTSSAEFNSAIQAGYFILAVRAVGLAAGPMAGFDKEAVDAEFFADGRFKSILVVNIGHPGEDAYADRLPRLDDAEVLRWA